MATGEEHATSSATDKETPSMDASVERINAALQYLLDGDELSTATIAAAKGIVVCRATADEWNAFVASEASVYPSTCLFWHDATQEILVVEYPSRVHDTYVDYLGTRIHRVGAVQNALASYRSSYDNSQEARNEPDLSYGPIPDVVEPLGVVPPPPGFRWDDSVTLRIEVGFSQGWGMRPGQLDHKALEIWVTRPCIAYVLCIHVDENLTAASYKRYEIDRVSPVVPALQPVSIPIPAPGTVVRFISRRLLALPDHANLSNGFPDPEIVVDLYAPLAHTRRLRRGP